MAEIQFIVDKLNEPPFSKDLRLVSVASRYHTRMLHTYTITLLPDTLCLMLLLSVRVASRPTDGEVLLAVTLW